MWEFGGGSLLCKSVILASVLLCCTISKYLLTINANVTNAVCGIGRWEPKKKPIMCECVCIIKFAL